MAQQFQWAVSGKSGDLDRGQSIAVDKNKNVLACGISLGTPLVIGTFTFNGYGSDGFVTKTDSAGNFLWAVGLRGGEMNGVSTDALGNVYVAGGCGNSIFYGTTNSMSVTSAGWGDAFITKYDPDGKVLWVRLRGLANTHDYANAIATDKDGNSYIVGHGQCKDYEICSYKQQYFISKYDKDGNLVWDNESEWKIYNYVNPTSIDVDTKGNCYMTGVFTGTVIFNNVTLTGSNSSTSIFLIKFNSNGQVVWGKKDGDGFSEPACIRLDDYDNFYLTGRSGDTTKFGNTILNKGMFICKYDSSGNTIWAKGGSVGTWGRGIEPDKYGNLFVTGWMALTSTFGEGANAVTLNPTKKYGREVFVAIYDTNGNIKGAIQPGGSEADRNQVMALAADDNGNCFITGGFSETTIFGSVTLNAPSVTSGQSDIFIAKVSGNSIVGLKELPVKRTSLIIQPNPNNGSFTLKYDNDLPINNFRLKIINVIGQIVYEENILKITTRLEKSLTLNLSSGTYFVIAQGGDNIETRKIIIQ